MKKRILALLLAFCLLLSGCASLLERPYTVVEPHTEQPAVGEDPSTLRVESYSELVGAVLYLVSQCQEEGRVQLVDYDGDVEDALNRACLEVAREDPLGAYAVDFIKNDYTRILTTYEANIYISYRRTPEQIRALVNVTGASAIRREVGEALSAFQGELALRVAYFVGDAASIAELVHQAYYDTPAAALGMPAVEIALYPDTGIQRIVEILLTYPGDAEALRRKSAELTDAAQALVLPLQAQRYSQNGRLGLLMDLLPQLAAERAPSGADGSAHSTAWDALCGGGADSEGLALAVQLLCDQMELPCAVTEGTLAGEARFWNTITVNAVEYQLDAFADEPAPRSSTDFAALGYAWEGQPEAGGTIPAENSKIET
ncbi:hypothetical protein NE547_02345 [Flavonifractor sp. DFI.6.63]|uniref:hypothetical protein n=1 Tax=Oscillospiraceae TaxID=216572 RepID=UPI00210C5610|nr:hypothetical protein [Flavonifractor sp. DFI.6.63]MCQ5028377.1 hypothetical protein [Flavonifractor sp. DFI.6.63]